MRLRTGTARAAAATGIAAGLTAGVDLLRWMRPGVLADPERSWAAVRLLLGLAAAGGAAAAGVAAASLFFAWGRTQASSRPLEPLPFRRATLTALTVAALLSGIALRFAALSRVPEWLWVDDVSLIRPALDLSVSPPDFADAIRPTPYGVPRPYGSVGVLYLEGYRAALRLCGTTVLGVRLPSALAGAASLVTAALLGRALLPAGGGMLTALVLAGLRWHLVLSRWAFVMIVVAPILDLAALALLAARRRRSAPLALGAGAVAGLGAHVYLSAWTAGAALAAFALWPAARGERLRPRLSRGAAFALGFAACAAPLFLLREGRTVAYFARTADHNVVLEMRHSRSPLPPAAAAADALASPWFLADPTPRHDLPGRARLPWPLGLAVAVAIGRALLRPREPLNGLLLCHGAAYVAATVAGGQADLPNGSRFAYLSTLCAVAAAAGILFLVALARPTLRRAAAVAAVGVVAILGALSARDLARWSVHPETFRGFHGEDTLIGRAAARWEAFEDVAMAPGLGRSAVAIDAIRRYRLDPDSSASAAPAGRRSWRLRIAAAGTAPDASERIVERVADPWGRTRAVVLARTAGGD